MDGESGELTEREECGRSMNRQDRDRGAGMRSTERTRKLIPEMRLFTASVRQANERMLSCIIIVCQ